jgi:hypothetical protein
MRVEWRADCFVAVSLYFSLIGIRLLPGTDPEDAICVAVIPMFGCLMFLLMVEAGEPVT